MRKVRWVRRRRDMRLTICVKVQGWGSVQNLNGWSDGPTHDSAGADSGARADWYT